MTVGCSVCSHLLVSIYPACVFTLTSPTWTSNSQRGGKDCQGTMHAERLSTDFSCLCVAHVRVRVRHLLHADFRRRHRTCTHTSYLWRQYLSSWVHSKLCRVTCSLLGAAHVLPSGRTRPRQELDLTGAMFSGTPPQPFLSELFGSQLWLILK